MNKSFRVSWNAFLEENSLFEGRSLITAENEREATNKIITEKSQEYRIKPHLIRIVSIHSMNK